MSETWRIGVGTTHWESFPFLIILIYSIGCTTLKKENTHTHVNFLVDRKGRRSVRDLACVTCWTLKGKAQARTLFLVQA